MNGGIGHAFDVLTPEELTLGIRGYRYFGFAEVAAMLERAAELSEEQQELLDPKYWDLVPADSSLGAAFEAVFQATPERFAPLSS